MLVKFNLRQRYHVYNNSNEHCGKKTAGKSSTRLWWGVVTLDDKRKGRDFARSLPDLTFKLVREENYCADCKVNYAGVA